MRQVGRQQFLVGHREVVVVRLDVLAQVDKSLAAVLFRIDEVRVLDDCRERQVGVRDVEPVDIAERLVELQERDDRRLVVERVQLGHIVRRQVLHQLLEDVRWRGGEYRVVERRTVSGVRLDKPLAFANLLHARDADTAPHVNAGVLAGPHERVDDDLEASAEITELLLLQRVPA